MNRKALVYYINVFLLLLMLTACTRKTIFSGAGNEPFQSSVSTIDKVKLEKQTHKYGCGAASLVSVLDYWNIKASQSVIVENYPPHSKKKGYSAQELKSIAKAYDTQAFVMQCDKSFLEKQILLGRPVIVPLFIVPDWEIFVMGWKIYGDSYNHYLVVYGFSRDETLLMDPDKGFKAMPTNTFLKMWEVNKQICLLVAK